jgi:hypothetical protein
VGVLLVEEGGGATAANPVDLVGMDLGGGGFCFHFLTTATWPKANRVLFLSRAWAQLPFGSSKNNEREETVLSV